MAKSSISIGLTRESKRIMQMVRGWPKRTKALQNQFTYDAAEDVRKGIMTRVPTTDEYKDYRKRLTVGRVDGMSVGQYAHTLFVPVKKGNVDRLDAGATLIYVYAKKNRSSSKKVSILEKYSPWPVDMLPFKPSSSLARVISRHVRGREVDAVRKKLTKTKSQWSALLAVAGAADRTAGQKTRSPKTLKAIPDVAFSALRLEFGVGGKAKAHWRPSILNLVKNTIPKMSRSRTKYDRVMADPKNTEWLNWPLRSKMAIRLPQAKKFQAFEERLGLKLGVRK